MNELISVNKQFNVNVVNLATNIKTMHTPATEEKIRDKNPDDGESRQEGTKRNSHVKRISECIQYEWKQKQKQKRTASHGKI